MNELANFAVNVAWQSSAIALAALIASFVLRRAAARFHHAALAFASIATAVVPVAGLFRTATVAITIDAPATPTIRPDVIAIVYLVFVLGAALSLGRAWLRVRRLRRSAIDVPPMEIADLCRAALGVGDVPIRASTEVAAPVTIGAVRPMILLPVALPAETLPAVIGHELAHVRRRDGVMQLVAELVNLVAGFNPLVRLLRRRMDIAREMACDELVTSTLVAPHEYAQALLAVAGRAIAPRYAMGIGHAAALELRLRHLREPRRTRTAHVIAAAAVIAATAFAFRLPLTLFATHPNFSGDWVLDARRTHFGAVRPYQS
ncbi:MAG TPA: M56 family metallopeptidase, partial [Thermoanaerobaculia bacterium]|nr:M56 family metallopeptidase [Thermoanaerobaculia bacterium]